MESNSNSEPQRQGTTGNDEHGASGKNPPISPGGTIKLTNSYERSPQSQERFKTFYRAWRSQWAQGDHIAPNIALYSVLAGMLIGSGLMGFFFHWSSRLWSILIFFGYLPSLRISYYCNLQS
ncbi:hypothetical protein DSO57_1026082 [Entomophthora muscae]|uniref:Uncharacterized protein n=1 Tax=Entomophthora muscae TaxID=34485 RepID=A0ACC2RGV7_9FUNG|nr:hypothetical protein DSO57_1026082 [Entomophthora muscae]